MAKPLEAIAGPLRRSSPESVDRMLIGLCAVIWLAFVGMLVGAIVVIAGMGRTRVRRGLRGASTSSSGYRWPSSSVPCRCCYVPATPLPSAPRKRPLKPRAPIPPVGPLRRLDRLPRRRRPKLKTFGGLADHVSHVPKDYNGPGSPAYRAATEAAAKRAVVNRLWLRATVGIAGAIGLALLAVVTGTYLLAVESDTAAIVAFVFAGVITCAMGAIPWVTLKKLRELGSSGS